MKLTKLLIIVMVAGMLVIMVGCGQREEEPAQQPEPEPVEVAAVVVDYTPTGEDIGTEAVCPVCGMTVTVEEGTPAGVYMEEVYYFCNADEKAAFAADPEKYLAPEEGEMEEPVEETTGQ